MSSGLLRRGRMDMVSRIEQLCRMMKYITGISIEESKRIILLTPTGKAIHNKEMTVMYEQQTENLYSVGRDLQAIPVYKKLSELLTVTKITEAMQKVILEDMNANGVKKIVYYTGVRNTILLNKQRQFLLEQQRRKSQC